MQALYIDLVNPIEIKDWRREMPSCSGLSWLGQKCRRFTRLAGQTLLCAIDAVFFWGKMDPGFPPAITKASLVSLSGVGLVFLPYNLDLIRKTAYDILFGYRAGHTKVWVIASAKALELISSLGLLLAGFAASVQGMAGNDTLQGTIYTWMVPWGEATLGLGIGMTAAYLAMSWLAFKSLSGELDRSKAEEIAGAFCEQPIETNDEMQLEALEEAPLMLNVDKRLAALIRFCMDKDTLEHFLEQLKKLSNQDAQAKLVLLYVVRDNIRTQLTVNLGGQLLLTLAGDVLMGIEKYYTPNSKVSASINLGVCSAYWTKVFVETMREVFQRRRMTEAVQENLETASFTHLSTSSSIQ